MTSKTTIPKGFIQKMYIHLPFKLYITICFLEQSFYKLYNFFIFFFTYDEAFAYMEMAAGDLSTAISLYFDNSGVANTNNNDYIEEVEDEVEEEDIQEVTEGEYNRILESQGIIMNI